MCIVIEASFYCVGIELVDQISALSQQFVKMATPMIDIIFITFAIISLNLFCQYVYC